jgi:hypothetical protein
MVGSQPSITTSDAPSSVKQHPYPHVSIEPFYDNPGVLIVDYFNEVVRRRNALVVPNWTDEIKRRIAQFA